MWLKYNITFITECLKIIIMRNEKRLKNRIYHTAIQKVPSRNQLYSISIIIISHTKWVCIQKLKICILPRVYFGILVL